MVKLDKDKPLLMSLKPVFQKLCQMSFQSEAKRPAYSTVLKREQNIVLEMRALLEKGYLLKSIYNIKPKHFKIILNNLYKRNHKLETIKGRIKLLSVVCMLIGKEGLPVTPLKENSIPKRYFEESEQLGKRVVMDRNAYIKNLKKMRSESPLMAIHASLMLYFGLTKNEALNFKPRLSHRNNNLIITVGTSRGKERKIPVETAEQRALITRACEIVNAKVITIKPKGISLSRWINKFDYTCKKFDIKPRYLTALYRRSQ